MRAVAPQIISPAISKNHTGNESSALPGNLPTRDVPALLVEDCRVGEFAQGDVEDPLDLGGVRHESRPLRHGRQDRQDQRGRHHRHDRMDPAHGGDQCRVESDLFVRFAQRGVRWRLAFLEATSREADFAAVGAQATRSAGEDQASLAFVLLLEHHREDRGVHVVDGRRPGLVRNERWREQAEEMVRVQALGDAPPLADCDERIEHTVDTDRLFAARARGWPRLRARRGANAAGRGITWGGTDRGIRF